MANGRKLSWLLPALAAAVLVVSLAPTRSAGAQSTGRYGPLVSAALKYDGTKQGECYMFMQRVVKEVTGRYVGGDYRQSYVNAGAVEVPLVQAQPSRTAERTLGAGDLTGRQRAPGGHGPAGAEPNSTSSAAGRARRPALGPIGNLAVGCTTRVAGARHS